MNVRKSLLLAVVAVLLVSAWFFQPMGTPTSVEPAPSSEVIAGEPEVIHRVASDPQRELLEREEPALAAQEPRPALTVRLVEKGTGTPVGRADVILHATHLTRTQSVDYQGQARFEDLQEGQACRIEVCKTPLPEGILIPRQQYRQEGWGDGYPIGREVNITKEDQEVTIQLERAARIFGKIIGPDGNPSAFTHVTAGNGDPVSMRVKEVRIDSLDGYYEAYLYPGQWILHASPRLSGLRGYKHYPRDVLEASASHPLRGTTGRPPMVRTLNAGEEHEFNFLLGNGPSSLTGQITDEHARPLAGLELMLYPHQGVDPVTGDTARFGLGTCAVGTTTDEQGRYELTGIHPADYKLQIQPDGCSPLARPGVNKLGSVQKPIQIAIDRGEKTLDVQLDRASPVHVQGKISLAPDWESQTGVSVDDLDAHIVLSSGKRRARDRRVSLSIDEEGHFSFHVEAREELVLLELASRGHNAVIPVTLPLPSPHEDQGMIVNFSFPD